MIPSGIVYATLNMRTSGSADQSGFNPTNTSFLNISLERYGAKGFDEERHNRAGAV